MIKLHLQSILQWLFWRWGFMNYLSQTSILKSSASQIAGITGESHLGWLFTSISSTHLWWLSAYVASLCPCPFELCCHFSSFLAFCCFISLGSVMYDKRVCISNSDCNKRNCQLAQAKLIVLGKLMPMKLL
jgi:hypothetical protein